MCLPAALHSFWLIPRALVFPFVSRFSLRCFALVITLLACINSISAQTNAQTVYEDEDVVRVNTELLLFPIRVRDRKGQAISGLTEKDLRLEDKDRVTSGLYFAEGVDRVALLFALDQSGSVRETISDQRDAALSLFHRFSERSSIAIMQFAETSQVKVPFSNESAAAVAGFRFHSVTNQRTAIFDAAAKAISSFDALPRVRSERRIVILISDGLDNTSNIKPATVIEDALAKRVSFYMIHIPLFEPRDGRLNIRRASRGFRELAEKTGGQYFLVKTADDALSTNRVDLAPIFRAIEEDLKSQYLLGFYISESSKDGKKHVFSLELVPPGIKYSVWSPRYSREHKFFVQFPRVSTPK